MRVFDVERLEQIHTTEGAESYHYPGVKIWEEPQPDARYVIGCDPSDGGQDFGVIAVWDIDKLEQVAQFRGKLRPDELAQKICDMALFYNHAFVGVERTTCSRQCLFLSKIYDNLYTTQE